MKPDTSEVLKDLAWLVVAVLLCLGLIELRPHVLAATKSIETASAAVAEAAAAMKSMARNAELDARAQGDTTAEILRQLSAFLGETEGGGALGSLDRSIRHIEQTTLELELLAKECREGAAALFASANDTLKPLAVSFEQASKLLLEAEKQVASNGTETRNVLLELAKAIQVLETQLNDPNIGKTLANIERTSFHSAESMESVDTALRPWRERMGRLKTCLNILSKAAKVALDIVF